MKSRFNKKLYIGREFKLKNFDKPIKILDARQNKDFKYTTNIKCVRNGLPVEVMYKNSNKYETSLFWCRLDALTDKRGDKVRNFLKINRFGCYYGVPKYKSTEKLHRCWYHMWERCSDINRLPYSNAKVCDEWRSYQNFLEWVYSEDVSNYMKNEEQDIDKDVLQFGVKNKIYSPETCIFLPSILNNYLSGISKRSKPVMKYLWFNGCYMYIPLIYLNDITTRYIRYYFLDKILNYFRKENKLNYRAYRALCEYNLKVTEININLISKYLNDELRNKIDAFLDNIFNK